MCSLPSIEENGLGDGKMHLIKKSTSTVIAAEETALKIKVLIRKVFIWNPRKAVGKILSPKT